MSIDAKDVKKLIIKVVLKKHPEKMEKKQKE
jgi:hypothetical protein